MDPSVIASMAKWPNVPDCYGWLHLDAQGHWLMGEWAGFGLVGESSEPKPSRVEHEGLRGFINRNYLCPNGSQGSQHSGAWALQNGPQRVWVTLALAPMIIRLHGEQVLTHTGVVVELKQLYLSSDGVVYCRTTAGPGAIESASMEQFSQGLIEIESEQMWQQTLHSAPLVLQPVAADMVERMLGFCRRADPAKQTHA